MKMIADSLPLSLLIMNVHPFVNPQTYEGKTEIERMVG